MHVGRRKATKSITATKIIGIVRAAFHIELTNLVYNLCRYSFLSRKETVTG